MLRAILANETLIRANTYRRFLVDLIRLADIDNGEAVPVLLDWGKCTVETRMLDEVLCKGYTSVGTALMKNEGIARHMAWRHRMNLVYHSSLCPTCVNYTTENVSIRQNI